MLKDKKILILLLVSSIGFYFLVDHIWSTCPTSHCSHELINNFLNPGAPASKILVGFFTFFLFLPSHYFKAWFKYIFSWALPLSLLLVAATNDGGGVMSFSRALVVQMHGVFFAGLSVLFILYHFYKTR